MILLGNLVADYDLENYPIGKPSLVDVIKLRMEERALTQANLSRLLGINPSEICEYLSSKKEPTLQQALTICKTLNIAPDIVLGE